MPISKQAGEKKEDFISRCIGEEVSAGKDQDQAVAICYSYAEKEYMSLNKWSREFMYKHDLQNRVKDLFKNKTKTK
jgi:hypothetical protein